MLKVTIPRALKVYNIIYKHNMPYGIHRCICNLISANVITAEPEEEVWSEEADHVHIADEDDIVDMLPTEEPNSPPDGKPNSPPNSPPDGELFVPQPENSVPKHLLQWLFAFLLALYAHFHLSAKVLSLLLGFFKAFLGVLGKFSTICATIAEMIPSSVHKLFKLQEKSVPLVRRYVVCKRCHQIYFIHSCVDVCGILRTSKTCSYQPYPNHPIPVCEKGVVYHC